MYYFIETACVAAEIWLAHLLYSSMFQKRSQPRWRMPVAYILAGLLMVPLSLLITNSYVRISIWAVLLFALAYTLFLCKAPGGMAATVLFLALVVLSDLLVSTVLLNMGFGPEVFMAAGPVRELYMVFAHIALFGMVMCVHLIGRRKYVGASLRQLLPVVPCWVISAALCLLLSWDILAHGRELSLGYVLVLLGLLYTDMTLFYFINRIAVQEQEKREQLLAEHHYAMQQEYYEQFRIQQEETRALWHDIQKYLRAVQTDESGAAIAQIQSMLDAVSCVVDVDNRVVNVILNEYAQSARNLGIALTLDIQVPRELFVTAVDLYVLIGNTMDNAIEACAALPEGQRSIHMKLKTHNDILFYEIENPCAPAYAKRPRGKEHGYGLQNVRRCVEKYNGTMEIQQEAEHFRLSAHLNSL